MKCTKALILSLFLSLPLWGQHSYVNIDNRDASFQKGKYDLTDYLYILVDTTGTLNFSDASSLAYADHFKPFSEVSLVDLWMNRHAFWLRLSIQSNLDQEVIWLTNFMEAEVIGYSKTQYGEVDQVRTGVLVPASEKYFNNQYGQLGVLPIHIPAQDSLDYYWRIQSQPVFVENEIGLDLNFTLLSPAYLSNYLQIDGFILALFVGFCVAVGIYYLIIFYFSKDFNYLWFFCFCLITPLAGIINIGYDLKYFWPESSFAHYYWWRAINLIIVELFFIIFSRSYLQTSRLTPMWDKVIWIIFGLIAIGFGLGTLILWHNPSTGLILVRLGQNGIIFLAISFLIIPVICIKKGHQAAKLYLIASASYLLGLILAILSTLQLLGRISHLNWATLGTWIQLSLFAFGLGQMFRQNETRRLLAQAEAKRLKEMDNLKTKLYTNITHEFRTPLTVISGLAEQIIEPKEPRTLIKGNSKRLLRLVNQMLDLAKLESGNLSLKMIQADVIPYLQYLVESFHSFADSKKIEVVFNKETDQCQMDFDEEKLQSIVSNLISNAIKFTPKGGKVELLVRNNNSNTLGVLKTPRVLELKIKDTGVGIPLEKLSHVFDRFYQVDDSTTREEEGTGIGLTLTKELVELMGGSINVESQLGKGTTFTLQLPIQHNAPLNEPILAEGENIFVPIITNSQEQPSDALSTDEGQNHLLIIEDNLDVVTYIRSCLQVHYRIEVAVNGEKGIEKAIELVPDIIISDVMMPLKDGFEVCATLKNDERTSHIPIILLTAKADAASRIEGLERGADAYLAKPFNKKELLVRLEKLIELRRRLQERYAKGVIPEPSEDKGIQMEDAFLQKIRQLIEDNLDDDNFGIPELCKALFLSRSQLHRKLKALTNQSTSHTIRLIRLQNAKKMLLTTDLTISEIAYDTGFTDPNHFSRVFKEAFGITPSKMRD